MKRLNIYMFIIITTIIMFSLTGCIEGEMHIKFNLDGSADIDFELLSSSSLGMLQGEGQDLFTEIKTGLKRDGFALEDKKKEGMAGFRATKHTKDPEELANLTFLGDIEKPEITITEGLFFNVYEFTHNMKIKLPGFEDEGDALAKLLNPEINFIISFPINPVSHNAPIVSEDGNTLQWPMSFDEENHVEVVVNVPNVVRIVMLIVAVLVAIIMAVVIVKKTSSKKAGSDKRISGNKN